jgi:hypothetical protein
VLLRPLLMHSPGLLLLLLLLRLLMMKAICSI